MIGQLAYASAKYRDRIADDPNSLHYRLPSVTDRKCNFFKIHIENQTNLFNKLLSFIKLVSWQLQLRMSVPKTL